MPSRKEIGIEKNEKKMIVNIFRDTHNIKTIVTKLLRPHSNKFKLQRIKYLALSQLVFLFFP